MSLSVIEHSRKAVDEAAPRPQAKTGSRPADRSERAGLLGYPAQVMTEASKQADLVGSVRAGPAVSPVLLARSPIQFATTTLCPRASSRSSGSGEQRLRRPGGKPAGTVLTHQRLKQNFLLKKRESTFTVSIPKR